MIFISPLLARTQREYNQVIGFTKLFGETTAQYSHKSCLDCRRRHPLQAKEKERRGSTDLSDKRGEVKRGLDEFSEAIENATVRRAPRVKMLQCISIAQF